MYIEEQAGREKVYLRTISFGNVHLIQGLSSEDGLPAVPLFCSKGLP